eukprot:6448653-Amphidinium_carterae.2
MDTLGVVPESMPVVGCVGSWWNGGTGVAGFRTLASCAEWAGWTVGEAGEWCKSEWQRPFGLLATVGSGAAAAGTATGVFDHGPVATEGGVVYCAAAVEWPMECTRWNSVEGMSHQCHGFIEDWAPGVSHHRHSSLAGRTAGAAGATTAGCVAGWLPGAGKVCWFMMSKKSETGIYGEGEGVGSTRGAARIRGRNACMLHDMKPTSVTAAADDLSAGCAGP